MLLRIFLVHAMTTPQSFQIPVNRRRGFTLVEISVVIVIVLVLAGLIFPAVLGIHRKANRMKTEALFGKLIYSLGHYYKDYKTFPDFGVPVTDGDVVVDLSESDNWERFMEVVALSKPDGSLIEEETDTIKLMNPKKNRYFDVDRSEIEKVGGSWKLVDAFGNSNIVVVLDVDLDERIKEGNLPDDVGKNLRQRIVVYTRNDSGSDFIEVRSWEAF